MIDFEYPEGEHDWDDTQGDVINQEQIDDETLQKVADVLHIPTDAIKNFNDEATVTFITNTFNNQNSSDVTNYGSMCTINPIEKIVELYERLLKIEQEKSALLGQCRKD